MSIQNIHFIDIETVPVRKLIDTSKIEFDDLSMAFKRKHAREALEYQQHPMDVAHQIIWEQKAALSAEFGKIVCISVGKWRESESKFYIKSFCGKNEAQVLGEFALMCQEKQVVTICAHNGKEFDFPFLYRRYLINGMAVPAILQLGSKKTWEYPFIDTMELWSHCQWKYKCSLDLLCHVLGLESPKKDMDGSMVSEVFYSMFDVAKDQLPFDKEGEVLKRIADYCSGDIISLVNVFCKLKGYETLKKDQIIQV